MKNVAYECGAKHQLVNKCGAKHQLVVIIKRITNYTHGLQFRRREDGYLRR